ncbi:hypothetical protein [Chengkuizengella axinellae]|uniref:Uncharacterized protein n=1 Tax=Chengkuizengella axinellae TaxID=3064388 RepID=A0ABT9IYN3_9BACL|nr:hypothetical protein [Chengkuizengella sp. 2205SS18-9]MDP5274474.1 hypothetical protein [Chengkuizengella sp. 2205SS18-9]
MSSSNREMAKEILFKAMEEGYVKKHHSEDSNEDRAIEILKFYNIILNGLKSSDPSMKPSKDN